MLLAGDIGGTNTRLAVFDPNQGPQTPLYKTEFFSAKYSGLEEIVKAFIVGCPLKIKTACFGVAGPVKQKRAKITNLPWGIDERSLTQTLGLDHVILLNDLAAIACSIPHLTTDDLVCIHQGKALPEGNLALLAPGTGLGEAFLTWDGTRYRSHASEGGHVNFAPATALEIELLCFMNQMYKHVSFERVCSGTGIPNIYRFFKETGRFEEPDWLAKALNNAPQATPVIFEHALNTDPPAPICTATLDMFLSILGSAAGNLALKVLSTGGVYLGGGILPRITTRLKKGEFMNAFINKGRLSELLTPMPVHIITNSDTALIGAACYGFNEIALIEKGTVPLKTKVSKTD